MGADKRPVLSVLPAPRPDAVFDPVAELRLLAQESHEAYRADPGNAVLLRECRATLVAILDASRQADGELAALFAEYGAS